MLFKVGACTRHLSPFLCPPPAAGKSTFLRLLQEHGPSYRVISEPLTRWQNVPSDEEVGQGGCIYTCASVGVVTSGSDVMGCGITYHSDDVM